jgi:selenocysteine-specific elongation factor
MRLSSRAAPRGSTGAAGPGVEKEAIRRCDIVLDPDVHAPTDRIDAILRLSPSEKKPNRLMAPPGI